MFGTYQRLGVHIYASNLEVIRKLRRKLKPEALRDPTKREARHGLYRTILQHHAEAAILAKSFRL